MHLDFALTYKEASFYVFNFSLCLSYTSHEHGNKFTQFTLIEVREASRLMRKVGTFYQRGFKTDRNFPIQSKIKREMSAVKKINGIARSTKKRNDPNRKMLMRLLVEENIFPSRVT